MNHIYIDIFDETVYPIRGGNITMISRTVRYTATLPSNYLDELKELASKKIIPSVNFAINEALVEYLKNRKAAQYEEAMKEAGSDKAFLARTMKCAEEFNAIDDGVTGSW